MEPSSGESRVREPGGKPNWFLQLTYATLLRVCVQLCNAIGAFQELDDRKFKTVAAAEDFITEVVRLPVLFIVGEHSWRWGWHGGHRVDSCK